MSFFLQSERRTGLEKAGAPSPTQYNPHQSQTSRRFACAPFGSTQGLSRGGRTQKKAESEKKEDTMKQEELALKDLRMKIKTQSTTQRVKLADEEQKPGVGAYDLSNSRLGKSRSVGVVPQHSNSMISKPKGTIPSIPADNLGFKENNRNEMAKVVAPYRAPPHPGSYQLRTSLGGKGMQWKTDTVIKREPEQMPGPGQYSQIRKVSKSMSCFHSGSQRFGRTHKITEEKQPGPGAYNIGPRTKPSHNATAEGYFNSKSSRFPKDVPSSTGQPAMYFDSRKKSQSVTHLKRIFHREETGPKQFHRESIFDMKDTNPGPGEYKNNIYGMSSQLQRALMRKQASNNLPKTERKVFEPRQEEDPGPGAYETSSNPKPKGKLWKKVEVVNLKEPEEPFPSPMEYTNLHNTIESKIKQMNAKLILTDEKPFNSGSERFKHYAQTGAIASQEDPEQNVGGTEQSVLKGSPSKKVKRLVMTTIKVRVPFGISSSKYEEKTSDYEGPAFYSKPSKWVKPSFNIKGQLQ